MPELETASMQAKAPASFPAAPMRLRCDAPRRPMVAALTGLAALMAALFIPPSHAADAWDISEDYAGVAIAEAHWTIDEAFPGTKVILDGRYSLRRRTGQARP